ncbi:MAG TPA: hypothetical protein VGP58_13050, partial [Pyrinomonadaceae bacterium]|nr:hypothetical protein [Pyrinomonadaceae bacterium]
MMKKNEQVLTLEKTIEPILENGNGNHALIETKQLPIAKKISNQELIAEEKSLIQQEESVEKNYRGIGGYLRLLKVSKVIGMLALYLYLDQYDLHHTQHQKQAEARMTTAQRLTWLAVLGEQFHKINLLFFHQFMLLLRRFFLGSEANKELNHEKQAVWLKDNLIELGPTFIKIGQSLGTRADLLPLPFVKALGELQDNVPSFPNEIA